jgi:hypothetical protein
MSPDTFVARLCALVPPGSSSVLAGKHALMSRVILHAYAHAHVHDDDEPNQLARFLPREHGPAAVTTPLRDEHLRDQPPVRLSWMKLLARVFRIDLSVCSRCGEPVGIVRAVSDPDAIAAELHGARM